MKFLNLLRLYQTHARGSVFTKIIDPLAEPHLLEAYDIQPGQVLSVGPYGKVKEAIQSHEVSEQSITDSLLRLKEGKKIIGYALAGYDSPSLEDTGNFGISKVKGALAAEGLLLKPLALVSSKRIPQDAAVLALLNPRKGIPEEHLDLIEEYVRAGGHLLLTSDPPSHLPGAQSVKSLAERFGIRIRNDIVIEKRELASGELGFAAQPVIRNFSRHSITDKFSKDALVVMNIASSLETRRQGGAGESYTPLFFSQKESWAEARVSEVFQREGARAEFQAKEDIPGPLMLGVSYEKELDQPEIALVWWYLVIRIGCLT